MSATCLVALLLALPADPGATLRLAPGKSAAGVEVVGIDAATRSALARFPADAENWSRVLGVCVAGKPGANPLLPGAWKLDGNVLRFTPRYSLTPGVRYHAYFDPAAVPGSSGPRLSADLLLPRPAVVPSVTVKQVYPTADTLPENTLKFYIHFSAPMKGGDAYRHIRLLRGAGKGDGEAVDLPFLELDQELWDPTGRRFTLFFDPGRIKRGLKPREEFGPALEEGKTYTLVIDRAWQDAEGAPLKEGLRKTFRVSAPVDDAPDPKAWKLSPPRAGTREPLRIQFPRPMDHSLVGRLLTLEAEGRRTPAEVTVEAGETGCSITPEKPWQAGEYAVVADTRLEDVSGNSIGRPFEVDVLRPVERAVKLATVRVPFRVKAGR